MQRLSLKHLAAPILAVLTSLSTGPLHAQQLISTTPQIFTLASDQPIPFSADQAESRMALISYSFASTSSSSADQNQPVPQSPAPQSNVQEPQPQNDNSAKQTQRILGIIPNFRAVNANVKLPPQSVKEKFVTASQDSFDYSSIVLPTAIAVVSLESNSTPEFGTGGVGFGRYLWHSVVDQTIENYMVEFVVPSIAHEDTRFYTLGSGGVFKRTSYALSRAFVTRSDSGKKVFNAGEIFGAGAAAGISTLYYPTVERSFSNTGGQWGLDVGIDAGTFVFKEFWPDINHHLFRGAKPATTPSH